MKLAITALVLMAFATAACILQNWWDKMTAEDRMQRALRVICVIVVVLLILALLAANRVFARDDGRYAASPLKQWFDQLKSGKGPCCSDADGSAVSDADWETMDGKYRVRLEGQWWPVPDDAVITETNRAGRTMVWPIYNRALGGVLSIDIQCFIPGSMT